MPSNKLTKLGGFTLIELMITMAVLAVLMFGIIYALNPARELARARNSQRKSDLLSIINAVGQNISDNNGTFQCDTGPLPTSTALVMATSTGTSTYNIAPCLVSSYLPSMPYDPKAATTTFYTSTSSYYTGYQIQKNASTSRVTVTATSSELGETITYTR